MATPPIDPRLVKRVGAFRKLLVILGSLALLRSVAWAIAAFAIAAMIVNTQSLIAPTPLLLGVAAICLAIRPIAAWLAEWIARYRASAIKHDLRSQATNAALHQPQQEGTAQGATTAALTTGADALDDWFALFLPSSLEAAVMPAIMFAVIAITDWVSLVILLVTVPLLGVFGWLIGVATADQAEKQFDAMLRLSGHFLDLLRGLETLRIFGVAREQEDLVRHVADDLRSESMKTLRIAFMSALALELIAMVGTALIAVMIGIRLSFGMMDLLPGLAVLIMAPEAYLPIRRVGSTFHASTEGAQAGKELLDLIDSYVPAGQDNDPTVEGHTTVPADCEINRLELDTVTVIRNGRVGMSKCSMVVERGDFVALTGSSGSGKTTALTCLVGLEHPTHGNATIGVTSPGSDTVQTLQPYPGMPRVAYVPQHPVILATTLRANVALGINDEDSDIHDRVVAALELAHAQELIELLDSRVGSGGIRLSGGQVRRIGLARAIVTDPHFLILDEPTSEVDETTAVGIRQTLNSLADEGVSIVVATHDMELMKLASKKVEFTNQTAKFLDEEESPAEENAR